MIKRMMDFSLSLIGLILFIIPMIFISIFIKLTSKGPIVHWSKRVGQQNKLFLMPKFRSMYIEAPQVATHLLQNSDSLITPFGRFLRKTSLDELPQLYSVFVGDMSLVGPRPALFNQEDLIQLRTDKGVHHIKPGITGWAQINGRDDLPIPNKVEFDSEYLFKKSLGFDFKIIFLTVIKVIKTDGVKH